ncbi:MAG: hypothetical protein JKY27_11270 [Magnetovibrio sp.]|nr:hypothetical protein [Magnetovibrio sp.]
MSVNAAGSASNVQQALVALRQTIQVEQVVAVAVSEAANQASQHAQQEAVTQDVPKVGPPTDGRGGVIDVKV